MAKEKVTKEQVMTALTETNAFMSGAANKLGMTTRGLRNYIQRYPDLQEHIEALREKRVDFAEGMLFRLIQEGNIAAIIFFLKTQAKHRGYTERQEITGADGEGVTIRIVRE